jgi:hypothetical protein
MATLLYGADYSNLMNTTLIRARQLSLALIALAVVEHGHLDAAAGVLETVIRSHLPALG